MKAVFYETSGKFGKMSKQLFCLAMVLFSFLFFPITGFWGETESGWIVRSAYGNDGWVEISGTVMDDNGSPLYGMVIANGQNVYSDYGTYNLSTPLGSNGEITIFCFCETFLPFRAVFKPDEAVAFNITMERPLPNMPELSLTTEVTPPASGEWTEISGRVTTEDGIPICAIVIANGQYMFSCDNNLGAYALYVPLDANGEITLLAFCEGFKPYKKILSVDPVIPVNITHIEITGPENILFGNCGMYTCTAYYDDGTSLDVTKTAEWSGSCENRSIIGNSLTVKAEGSPGQCSVTASYEDKNNTMQISEVELGNCDVTDKSEWVTISGNITYNGVPLCAMVLANGQHMFTCEPSGKYNLTVPLDSSGQITLFGFCEGLMTFKTVLNGWQTDFDIDMADFR